MIKGLLWLVGGTVAFWALLTYPARLLWPDDPTFAWSTTAAVICLVPTALTLAWTRRAYKGQPEQQLLAVFGGTAVRMVVVVAGGMILFLTSRGSSTSASGSSWSCTICSRWRWRWS